MKLAYSVSGNSMSLCLAEMSPYMMYLYPQSEYNSTITIAVQRLAVGYRGSRKGRELKEHLPRGANGLADFC